MISAEWFCPCCGVESVFKYRDFNGQVIDNKATCEYCGCEFEVHVWYEEEE